MGNFNRFRHYGADHDQLMRPTIHQERLVITQNLEPIFPMLVLRDVGCQTMRSGIDRNAVTQFPRHFHPISKVATPHNCFPRELTSKPRVFTTATPKTFAQTFHTFVIAVTLVTLAILVVSRDTWEKPTRATVGRGIFSTLHSICSKDTYRKVTGLC